eukprot:scaffold293022_cov22-Tisochrysis_lutea.AAC.1
MDKLCELGGAFNSSRAAAWVLDCSGAAVAVTASLMLDAGLLVSGKQLLSVKAYVLERITCQLIGTELLSLLMLIMWAACPCSPCEQPPVHAHHVSSLFMLIICAACLCSSCEQPAPRSFEQLAPRSCEQPAPRSCEQPAHAHHVSSLLQVGSRLATPTPSCPC